MCPCLPQSIVGTQMVGAGLCDIQWIQPLCSTSHGSIDHSPADVYSLPAAGLTLTEAQNINRSLLELGNVISALMQTAPHVPYRSVPALLIKGLSIRSLPVASLQMRMGSRHPTCIEPLSLYII